MNPLHVFDTAEQLSIVFPSKYKKIFKSMCSKSTSWIILFTDEAMMGIMVVRLLLLTFSTLSQFAAAFVWSLAKKNRKFRWNSRKKGKLEGSMALTALAKSHSRTYLLWNFCSSIDVYMNRKTKNFRSLLFGTEFQKYSQFFLQIDIASRFVNSFKCNKAFILSFER